MEAVEMFGSERENLQRTTTKRSNDITVYSLLAQRCWRDVAKHIGTGITPRQCEERYLQLIVASKRFDEQNVENGLVKVPLHSHQPYAVPVTSRNKSRATKFLPDSCFESINDLVQYDVHSSHKTYKGPNQHKRKRPSQSSTMSLSFDVYDMEIDDEHTREVTKLKKQYAKQSHILDIPTQQVPAKFTKQVTEVAKVRPARVVENVNIYKKHYIADTLAQTFLSPKRNTTTTTSNTKQFTTTVEATTTANVVPKRKPTTKKVKNKVNTRRKDAADSDIESYGSWKSCDLLTDDSVFDTSSSSDYYSSENEAEQVSGEGNNHNHTKPTKSYEDGVKVLVRHVLSTIVTKIESTLSNTMVTRTSTETQPVLPLPTTNIVDEGNDLSDSDLESAYSSSSSSSSGRAGNTCRTTYHNSNILYNYEFFEENSADNSDTDDLGSVDSLCSVSSNSTTTDYTPFIDPALYKYDESDFLGNDTATNTTLNNTLQNKNVAVVQPAEKGNSVADVLAELVDTIVARLCPSPVVTTVARKVTVPKTVTHSRVSTTNATTTHQKLFKNNHNTTPIAPIITLPPLPPADEALLKSLLPTRRYRKKDIKWHFLALLVGRRGSEIRAYVAQWRYEKRVELLNKLITLREHSTNKKKSKRNVRTVRRPKKTANPSKITPSNPTKATLEKKNASTMKAASSTLILPTTLANNSPSQTTATSSSAGNATTLTLHEMPPPSLHPVFDHTLLRAFLNVPGANRNPVGTGGTTLEGEAVRAEFHTEHVLNNGSHDHNIASNEVKDTEELDSGVHNNDVSTGDAMDVEINLGDKSGAINSTLETRTTTIIPDSTHTIHTTNNNVTMDPISRELTTQTLQMSENEIEVAEILTDTGSVQSERNSQLLLPHNTVSTAEIASKGPSAPNSTVPTAPSAPEKTQEKEHVLPPDDANVSEYNNIQICATIIAFFLVVSWYSTCFFIYTFYNP